MPRKKSAKPVEKAHLCWSWKKRCKAAGEAAEQRGDTATAERCRCHRPAGVKNGRCHRHGGTASRGPRHPRYTSGKYSQALRGIFAPVRRSLQSVEDQATLRDEVAIGAALVLHDMEAINDAVPAAELWTTLRQMTRTIHRHRDAGDRQTMARLLNERDAFILEARPPSTRELTRHLEIYRKLFDTEEKRKDRAAASYSPGEVVTLVESMALAVTTHVTSEGERAAVGEAFMTLLQQADYPALLDRPRCLAPSNAATYTPPRPRGGAPARRPVLTDTATAARPLVMVSVTTCLGFSDLRVKVVGAQVTDPAQRAAIGNAFALAMRRAGLPDRVDDRVEISGRSGDPPADRPRLRPGPNPPSHSWTTGTSRRSGEPLETVSRGARRHLLRTIPRRLVAGTPRRCVGCATRTG